MKDVSYVKKVLRPSNQSFIRINNLMGRFRAPVWIIGAGRSGTTWLSELLCARKRYRYLFEPFQPTQNPGAGFLSDHFYLRPGENNSQLLSLADSIFSGRGYFPGSDTVNNHKIFDGLLVKDISANLFGHALHRFFPDIDIIFMVRNPFAVALSRQNKREWKWFNDPLALLEQQNLKEDYLEPYCEFIADITTTDDYILKQILIWSIIHYVPFRQFRRNQIQIVFYEDLLRYTNQELQRLESSFSNKRLISDADLSNDVLHKPSRTTLNSPEIIKERAPGEWKKHITDYQLTVGNEILNKFGLGYLYYEDGVPAISPSDLLSL